MPLKTNESAKAIEMLPGVVRRTLTFGDKMSLHEVRLDKGAVVPMHTHPHEQTGYCSSGRLRFVLGEGDDREVRDLGPGDAWMVPSEVPHEVTALEDCVVIDVFGPPRDEYRD
jgi:quercetin dioxygenase-like cupin family protein